MLDGDFQIRRPMSTAATRRRLSEGTRTRAGRIKDSEEPPSVIASAHRIKPRSTAMMATATMIRRMVHFERKGRIPIFSAASRVG